MRYPAAISDIAPIETVGEKVDSQPVRVLGGIDRARVVIGAIIGVEIFFTPSKIAALTDEPWRPCSRWPSAGRSRSAERSRSRNLRHRGGVYHCSGAQYEILRDA